MERKEAIQIIKNNWPSDRHMLSEALESLFPELKESEDEKIRKELLNAFKEAEDSLYMVLTPTKRELFIAWLEKQGEQKPSMEGVFVNVDEVREDFMQEVYEVLNADPTYDRANQIIDAFDNLPTITIQKHADKVETKFKIGDWIVTPENKVLQITSIEGTSYRFNNESHYWEICYCDEKCRLWTIQDAKDGDIVATEPIHDYQGSFVAIYKGGGLGFFNSYCFVSHDGRFYKGAKGHDIRYIHPATKEQHDTLTKAMTDAGYDFDFKKKELKKIEQKPAWSEEDKNHFNNIIQELKNQYDRPINASYKEMIISDIDWLKYLKDRVQPKHEWNEDDNLQLQAAIDICKSSGHTITSDWLKSLKDRYTWKPNKEQIDVVKHVIDHVPLAARDRSILDDLYLDLRRLTNYE